MTAPTPEIPIDILRCPDCHDDVTPAEGGARCAGCGRALRRHDGVWDLWPAGEDGFGEGDRWWQRTFDETARRHGPRSGKASMHHSHRVFTIRQRVLGGWPPRPRGQRILDAGCGPGLFSAPWAADNLVVGVDAAGAMARAAADNGLAAARASGFDLPFHDGVFDGAVNIEVLQIVSDPGRLLSELVRVVRPGGWILLSTHNGSSIFRRVKYRHFPDPGPPHNLFPYEALAARLRGLGCDRVDGRYMYIPFGHHVPARGLLPRLAATSMGILARKRR